MQLLQHNHRIIWRVLLLIAVMTTNGNAQTSDVIVDDSVRLTVEDERELPLRVVYPDGAAPLTIIVLSHGTFSSGKKYDLVAHYWAEHGYAVVLPDHRDANFGEFPKSEDHMIEIIKSRVRDLIAIADQLEVIEKAVPGLSGRISDTRLVAAGHSVGTQVALSVGGLRMRNPVKDELIEYDEDRYMAVVLLSDPGKMALMPEQTWLGGGVPTFLATGPDDYGLMGDGRRPSTYQNEILKPEHSAAGHRYLLTIQGMDHQFGGLIKKKTDDKPDYEGLELFNELSTVFLDKYAGGDKSAEALLEPGARGSRAQLSIE